MIKIHTVKKSPQYLVFPLLFFSVVVKTFGKSQTISQMNSVVIIPSALASFLISVCYAVMIRRLFYHKRTTHFSITHERLRRNWKMCVKRSSLYFTAGSIAHYHNPTSYALLRGACIEGFDNFRKHTHIHTRTCELYTCVRRPLHIQLEISL